MYIICPFERAQSWADYNDSLQNAAKDILS